MFGNEKHYTEKAVDGRWYVRRPPRGNETMGRVVATFHPQHPGCAESAARAYAKLLTEGDRILRRVRETIEAYDEGTIDRDDVIDDLRALV